MNNTSIVSVRTQVWIERKGPPFLLFLTVVALGVVATATLTHFKIGHLRKLADMNPDIAKWGMIGGGTTIGGSWMIAGLVYRFIIVGTIESKDIHESLQRMQRLKKKATQELKKQKKNVLQLEREYQRALSKSTQELAEALIGKEGESDDAGQLVMQVDNNIKNMVKGGMRKGKKLPVEDENEVQNQLLEQRQQAWNYHCLKETPMNHQVLQLKLTDAQNLQRDYQDKEKIVSDLVISASQARSLKGLAQIEVAIQSVFENGGLCSKESSEQAEDKYARDLGKID